MKKLRKIVIVFSLLILCTSAELFAHSGRTDSYGGHRDNQNKSGLGSYHYHCGGHPAHLHNNGVCPYSTSSVTKTESTVKEKPKEVLPESIKIKQGNIEIYVGDSKTLTAIIYPDNVFNTTVMWQSSNVNVANVKSNGEVIGISEGKADITVSTSNNKKATITVEVKEKEVEVLSTNITSNSKTESKVDNSEESSAAGVLVGTATLGGVGYLAYKKSKKKL